MAWSRQQVTVDIDKQVPPSTSLKSLAGTVVISTVTLMSGNCHGQQQAQSGEVSHGPLVTDMREQAGGAVVFQSILYEAQGKFDDRNLIGEPSQRYTNSRIIWQIQCDKIL